MPEFATDSIQIKVKHLLNHTSGIKSYTRINGMMSGKSKSKDRSIQDIINLILNDKYDFKVGEKYRYNNSAYYLLGAIIERTSGMSFENYLKRNFFIPFEMNSTFMFDPDIDESELQERKAIGYKKADSLFFESNPMHPSFLFSAGGMSSTVNDLWKWNKALVSGKILNKNMLHKAWEQTKLNTGEIVDYGFGWDIGRIKKFKVLGHSGFVEGFTSYQLIVPEANIYVCVLENSFLVSSKNLAYDLAEKIIFNPNNSSPKTILPNTVVLDDYIGQYKIKENDIRTIFKKEGKLFSKRNDGIEFEIIPVSKDTFKFALSNSTLIFIRNESGTIEAVKLIDRRWSSLNSIKIN